MLAILTSLLRPLAPYLAAAALLLGALFYIVVLRHEVADATQKNATLTAQNLADLSAINAYKAQELQWNAALDALDAQNLKTNNAVGQITRKIVSAPAADNGPVAPVLAQALDNLRALQGDAP